MKKNIKYIKAKTLIILLVIVIAINIGTMIILTNTQYLSNKKVITESYSTKKNQHYVLINKYRVHIKQIGAEKSYADFKNELGKISDENNQHIYAHLFGEALYKEVGLKGISICDDAYTYGCYHSFFGFAIQEHGLEIATELKTGCEQKNTVNTHNCIHGIGHSIMYSLGDKRLVDALKVCSEISASEYLFHCTNGVFMEFNMNTINNPSGEEKYVRKVDNNYYEPCYEIPMQYQTSCFHQLPQWWNIILNEKNNIVRIGILCNDIPDVYNQEKCYLATGSLLLSTTNSDVTNALIECRKMPDDFSILLCQRGFFESGKGNQNITSKACSKLYLNEKEQCNKIFN